MSVVVQYAQPSSLDDGDIFQDAQENLEDGAGMSADPSLPSAPNSTFQGADFESQAGIAPRSHANGSVSDGNYPLHRAVFNGAISEAVQMMKGMSSDEIVSFDSQGNTALHIAVLRRRVSVVLALLEAGFPADALNQNKWPAIDDAIALKDKELVKVLHSRQTAAMKAELKSKKTVLLHTLQDIPDLQFQLKWELRSPVLGVLLRKYAPNDTYEVLLPFSNIRKDKSQILVSIDTAPLGNVYVAGRIPFRVWKKGTKMRVDGSMMGLDVKRTSILPVWKRGHFSLLYDGSSTPSTMLLCDHVKHQYWDLYAEKKKHKPSLDEEAALVISDGPQRSKVRANDFHFRTVKSWFGGDATEKIEGWKTKIFEAAGKMIAVTIIKQPFEIPEQTTFDEYLRLEMPEDIVREEPVDLTSMDLMSSKSAKSEAEVSGEEVAKKKKQARKFSGRCWMAENFPMSLTQLLPMLEVIGNANKHIARCGNFLRKYGDMSLFPVKLQMPLFYTIYALVSFCKFDTLAESSKAEAKTDEWYELPANYELRSFNDAQSRKKRRSLSYESMDKPVDMKDSDAEILKQMGL